MVDVGDYLRPLMLKDLRTQCRARNLNPGGSRSALADRVGEHMTSTQDFTIFSDPEPSQQFTGTGGGSSLASMDEPAQANNYGRPGGQNVGNHITDRPSSRVTAPPGGQSQVFFGDASPPQAAPPKRQFNTGNPVQHPEECQRLPPSYHPSNVSNPSSNASPDGLPHAPIGHFSGHGMSGGHGQREVNNYSRSGGQNVGNFLSDRPSSRVSAPPGGASQVSFG